MGFVRRFLSFVIFWFGGCLSALVLVLLQARSPDGSVDDINGVSGDSSEPDSLSPEKQAIIGAVVGGVAVIAITAGILFFLIKKHRWDQIRQREKALLALHAPPPAYDSSDTSNSSRSSRKPFPSPLLPPVPVPTPARPASVSIPTSYQCHVSRDIEEQLPAYDAPSIPVYDPSRYQQQQQQPFRPTSTVTLNSGPLHYFTGDTLYRQRSSQLSVPFQGHRHTIQSVPALYIGSQESGTGVPASNSSSAPVGGNGMGIKAFGISFMNGYWVASILFFGKSKNSCQYE
ncbi:uncharacterized protein EURHEDRAFT_27652 [Aspergillus ruber CBS 135680]|uniref:Uncharacterized protein n=1 Tax=Aspergillus ruber (strain CBS 135680) TaxID=1388766 RepID=A0A017SSF5_ASPRC|nr:uncharacterized protein EURHEDRAFT_27652 [Aspergillus ruber CBS 135680]EYE99726.1 hypothetical protein EURHEDRAFT_27652 [Aspergillus ruber CBS 135680]